MGVNGIYGLSGSGLDVESLVKAGMMSKQTQYDKMYKNATKQEWIKEAYNNVYAKLKEFQDVTSNFKLSSTLMTMGAKSSNEGMVTATATGSALAMSHKVEVKSVATNAYLMSADKINRVSGDPKAANSNKLADSIFQEIGDVAGSSKYVVKSKDGKTSVVEGDDVALKFSIGTGEVGDDGNEITKEISYTYKELADGKTFSGMATDIKNLGLGLSASYDSVNDSFQIYNSESGEKNRIDITAGNDNAATLLTNLNLRQSRNGELGVPDGSDPTKLDTAASGNITFGVGTAVKAYGTDAAVTIDGKEYRNLEKNYLSVAGVNYTFHDARLGETSTVSVTQDTEAIKKNMQEFVDKYNDLIDYLNGLIKEESSDYEPLTDAEKKDMTESQIKTWEEKAKKGLLSNSSILRNIVSSLRESIYTRVDSVDSIYNSASAIGITGSTDSNGKLNYSGHLTLDMDKLEKALNEDPDCVYQLFASDGDGESEWAKLSDEDKASGKYNHLKTWSDLTEKEKASGNYNYLKKESYGNTGIANRLYYTSLTDGMDKVEDYAGLTSDTDDQSSLGLKITSLKARMASFKTMMDKYQDSLYKKYDNLEVLIAKMSVQLAMVTGNNG